MTLELQSYYGNDRPWNSTDLFIFRSLITKSFSSHYESRLERAYLGDNEDERDRLCWSYAL